jgi:hypothetical protein
MPEKKAKLIGVTEFTITIIFLVIAVVLGLLSQ